MLFAVGFPDTRIMPLPDTNSIDDVQVALIDPGSFRIINELLQKEVKGKDRARVETLSFAAMEGEERIE